MQKFVLTTLLAILTLPGFGQKFGYVDTKFVLDKIPEYADAQKQLNTLAQKIEDSVANYHTKIFGVEGLYFIKKKELVKPVQDEVFKAVEKVAKDHKLQVMFDKSGGLTMIYTNPIHDYTDFVLEEMGLGDPDDTVK